MKIEKLQPVLLKDYAPSPFLVDTVELDFDFKAGEVLVSARLAVRRNPLSVESQAALKLNGEDLETLSVAIDGRRLEEDHFVLNNTQLAIADVPDAFVLQTVVRILPVANDKLSGLFRSANGFFTQCEAQGFRRITWFLDRPDVMSRYSVIIHADRNQLPLLLSNGNPIDHGDEPDMAGSDRHWARWEDPFPKPCYLFALVAARLEVLRDSYQTRSGRHVDLAIYVEPGKLDQCGHAMAALKKAMRWDEDVYGLECDLDHYMIVAVDDFNMGAMENKGLNIFNTKNVLARPDVATDADYERIDRVVAHEYFHNWTGNRVTCRDWFQLSLKEGLTVFRDQEFGADMHGRDISRIRDVRSLRAAQFPEDAGPMAHPVRPSSYLEINNFYTATVYQKGAEVVRMIQTLIGREAFRHGMDIYFARHDGQAVTCDEFVAAMAASSGADFGQFMRWYDQAGTPRITAKGRYDAAARRYVLTLLQGITGSVLELPFHIPVTIGLVGPDGVDMPLRLNGETNAVTNQRVISLTKFEQEFVFEDVNAPPVPSLLREFSAPVIIDFSYSDEDLTHLLAYDKDPFNRWEAGQRLAGRLILTATAALAAGGTPVWRASFAEAAAQLLASADNDPAFVTETLTLPAEATLAEHLDVVDPMALHTARRGLSRFLAEHLGDSLAAYYARYTPSSAYQPDAGRRALRNLCLGYLSELELPGKCTMAMRQFNTANNMTDQLAALAILAQNPGQERRQALSNFYERWKNETLVINKWLTVQSNSNLPETLNEVKGLIDHPAFDMRNPNKVYALLGGFAANHVRFHDADGAGYRFIAQQILTLDKINPQVAARLTRCFDRWRRFDVGRQAHARSALESLHANAVLSRDVFEIVERALA